MTWRFSTWALISNPFDADFHAQVGKDFFPFEGLTVQLVDSTARGEDDTLGGAKLVTTLNGISFGNSEEFLQMATGLGNQDYVVGVQETVEATIDPPRLFKLLKLDEKDLEDPGSLSV